MSGTRDTMFYPGSAPHGGGKSLHPASLILMMMITVTRVLYLESYCLNLTCPTCGTCESCPSWGALPLLIYVEGVGYMWSPIRIRISLPSNTNRIQVLVLNPCKIIFLLPFLLNRPTVKREPAFWALGLVIRLSRPPGYQ